MEASTPLSNIPNDIIQLILLQLPMKAVIWCRCVCKQWRSLIDDSDFKLSYRGEQRVIIVSRESKSQDHNYWNSRLLVRSTSHDFRLQRHKSPFGEAAYLFIRALCSCNGFVLVVAERDILLWNPSTRCSTKVLEWPYPKEVNSAVILGGLCYESCTRDYKAVLSVCPILLPGLKLGYPFLICASLKHKEWRPVQFPYNLNSARGSVEFRNTFHWWASDIKDWDWDRDYLSVGDRNMIVYFDPVHDEFRILPTPELGENYSIAGLGVIDGCLSMARILHKEEKCKIQTKKMQVLIMKEYGRQESWTTAFAIQMPAYIFVGYNCLAFYSQKNNAQQVLFFRDTGRFRGKVYVYDRKKDELREVLIDDLGLIYRMCVYIESLACLPLRSPAATYD